MKQSPFRKRRNVAIMCLAAAGCIASQASSASQPTTAEAISPGTTSSTQTEQTEKTLFTINVNGKSFKTAVEEIEKITGVAISYSIGDVNETAPVKVVVNKGTIQQILNTLVASQNLTYTISKKNVILKKKAPKKKEEVKNQASTITGTILDKDGEPLIGALVSVAGTNNGVMTDIDGNYTLKIENPGKAKIHVQYVGFYPMDVPVSQAQNNKLDIIMQTMSGIELGEVIVVGYGAIKKESLSSAISTLDGDELSNSLSVNTSGAVAGKIAGINSRQSDGRPGNWTSINVRNMGTPLYVVDGVQMDERQFNNIAFQDIESISVLKDASASIYGVRAANGVVVVTTKRGKKNLKNKITFDASYGWQQVFRYPQSADAYTFAAAQVQSAIIRGGASPYTAEQLEAYRTNLLPSTDWRDEVLRASAPMYNVNLNATGGSESMTYYVSVGHTRQESLVKDFGFFERTNIQSNITADFAHNLHFTTQINGRVENTESTAWNRDQGWSDAYSALFYGILNNSPLNTPYANNNPEYPALTGPAGYTNPANLNRSKIGKENDRWFVLQANASLEWDILKGLKLKGIFSYYNAYEVYKGRAHNYKLYSYDSNTESYHLVKDAQVAKSWATSQYMQTLNSQISLSYKKEWQSGHNLDAFVGMEAYKYGNPGFSYSGLPTMDVLKTTTFTELTNFSEWNENWQTRLGYMGRINYDYNHRYLVEFSARYDGSWKFPPHHRWGFFPSVSAGWRLTQENFFQKLDIDRWLTDLKIRVSYGVMGDDNVSGYRANDFRPGFNYNNGKTILDGTTVITSSIRSLPVTNISWIKAHAFDVGFDANLFDTRLSLTVDYFDRKRTGLPAGRYDIVVPTEIGFSWPNENLNSDKVRGFDGSIRWNDRIGDFNYTVGGNITLARGYTWEEYKPVFSNSRDYYVYNHYHRYSNQSWGKVCLGQFQNWEQIASYPVDIDGQGNSTLRPGDLIYKDLNGDGVITEEDQKPLGVLGYEDSRTPIINYNFNLAAEWKGFDLAADFTGAAHLTYIQNYEARQPFWGDGNSYQNIMGDAWHLSDPFDANSELIPGYYPMFLTGNTVHSNYDTSDFWMQDVWYIKMRNLTVGYTFPERWTKKAAISKLRIYCSFQNLFSIDNVRTHTDPEIAQASGFAYPTTRVYSMGINVVF